MKKIWVCSICGQSTKDVDMDYLIGTDHIACLLKIQIPKIENWNKLEGQEFDIMGVPCVMQNTQIDDTTHRYTVWVIEKIINQPLMRVDLYLGDMEIDTKTFIPNTFSAPPYHNRKTITKDHIKNPSIFIETIGTMMMGDSTIRKVLDYLNEHSGNVTARGGMSASGIIGKVMSAGTAVTYSIAGPSSHSYSPGPGISGSSGNNLW